MSEKLQIVSIERKSGTSSRTGKPYSLVEVQDGYSGRKAAAFGDWANDWKIGDEIEVEWVEKGEYKGVKQWIVNDPNSSGPKGGGQQAAPAASGAVATAQPNIVTAYQIAAALAPLFFDKDDIKLARVTKLANAVMKELEGGSPAPAAAQPEPAPAPVQSEELEEDLDDDDDELF
jgi:hypothetical protein